MGISKDEARAKLGELEAKVAELRAIIEAPEVLVFDPNKIYVGLDRDGTPYILAGDIALDHYRWHSFDGVYATCQGWLTDTRSGQAAIDKALADNLKVWEFSNPSEGIKFFYENYIRTHASS